MKYIYSLLIILISSSNCLVLTANNHHRSSSQSLGYYDEDNADRKQESQSSLSGQTEIGYEGSMGPDEYNADQITIPNYQKTMRKRSNSVDSSQSKHNLIHQNFPNDNINEINNDEIIVNPNAILYLQTKEKKDQENWPSNNYPNKDNQNVNGQQLMVQESNALLEATNNPLIGQSSIPEETVNTLLSVQFEANGQNLLQTNITNYLTLKDAKLFEFLKKISPSDPVINKDGENVSKSQLLERLIKCFDYGSGNHCQVTFDNNKIEIDKFFNDMVLFFLNTEDGSKSLYLHDDKKKDPKKKFTLTVNKKNEEKILNIEFKEESGNSRSNTKTIFLTIFVSFFLLLGVGVNNKINEKNKQEAKNRQQNLPNNQ